MQVATKMTTLINSVLNGVGDSVKSESDLYKLQGKIVCAVSYVYSVGKVEVVSANESLKELARDVSVMAWNDDFGEQTGYFYEKMLNDYLQERNSAAANLVLGSIYQEVALAVMDKLAANGGVVDKGLVKLI